MLDELLETFESRSRKPGSKSSDGLLGRLGRLLDGGEGDHGQSSDPRRSDDRRGDDYRGERRYDDDGDYKSGRRKRRGFEFEMGDD